MAVRIEIQTFDIDIKLRNVTALVAVRIEIKKSLSS